MSDAQYVWTFQLVGGQTFDMKLPNNPPLNHDGQRTLWKLVCTKLLAQQAMSAFQAFGANVNMYVEQELPEQVAERQALLGIPSGGLAEDLQRK